MGINLIRKIINVLLLNVQIIVKNVIKMENAQFVEILILQEINVKIVKKDFLKIKIKSVKGVSILVQNAKEVRIIVYHVQVCLIEIKAIAVVSQGMEIMVKNAFVIY